MYSLAWGSSVSGWGGFLTSRARLQRQHSSSGNKQQRGDCLRRRATGSSAAGQQGSYFERVQGWQGPLKAAVTSGSLSAAGDVLAQLLTAGAQQPAPPAQGRRNSSSKHSSSAAGSRLQAFAAAYDPLRTLRMFGFGFAWYGPYQYYWYNLLDHCMPLKTTANFLAKVTLNQLALAPVTLAAVFGWNLALTGRAAALPAKLQHDLVPSMVNGWKFWVPAASLNFYAVPVQHQVLYMSCCGMLWTAYLSYISAGGSAQ